MNIKGAAASALFISKVNRKLSDYNIDTTDCVICYLRIKSDKTMNQTNIDIGLFLGSEFGEGFGYPKTSVNLPSIRDVLKFTLFNFNFLKQDDVTNREAFRYWFAIFF